MSQQMIKRLIPLLAVITAATVLVSACRTGQGSKAAGPGTGFTADPAISRALAQVNIDSVRTYIDELVALHTRHTLSAQTDPERGLGAAVAYLERRCGRWALEARGRCRLCARLAG